MTGRRRDKSATAQSSLLRPEVNSLSSADPTDTSFDPNLTTSAPPSINGAANRAPERPGDQRRRSVFKIPQRPRYTRAKSTITNLYHHGAHNSSANGSGANGNVPGSGGHAHSRHGRHKLGRAQISVPENLPMNTIHRLAQRTRQSARLWYLRQRHAMMSHKRNDLEKTRELERSELLFSQAFAGTPMVLLAASSLQAEDSHEKSVPVLLSQLSVRVTQEQWKHYRHMLRIHLEYGAGLSLVRWEILRGYRDLFYLRTKLKSQMQGSGRRVKLPKLPRASAFGLKVYRNRQKIYFRNSEDASDSEDEVSLSELSDSDDDKEDQSKELENKLRNDGEAVSSESGDTSQGFFDSNGTDTAGTGTEANGVAGTAGASSGTAGASSGTANEKGAKGVSNGAGGAHRASVANVANPTGAQKTPHQDSILRYSKAIEDWLTEIKDLYSLRSNTNTLLQFFELSHLSLKLSPEYAFHGKEGNMIVRSLAKDMGWHQQHLHPHDLKAAIERHTKKWVIVKDSFVVIVNSINSTKIREVFLVDSSFKIKHIEELEGDSKEDSVVRTMKALPDPENVMKKQGAKSVFLHLQNNERELRLATMNTRDLRRWQASILQMKSRTPWADRNRFDSFAPVRKNVFGQWFVDGRDYYWVLSEALENARDTIFILDWWLSPELYLRRPPEGNQKWRLDRVLKRKAEQGVKIYVVVYRNVGPTIPIDSLWTKQSLLDLHPNIFAMRSPHQFSNQKSLFWAHHEKLCVIDSTVAFNGGLDLCYGRWDTWQHTLTDDAPSPFLSEDPTPEEWAHKRTQLFPGKDYSNARVKDFFELNKPYEDMYDRNYVPRMPWHDIHQMVLGQPARDFARHFVQRWNYLLRLKLPSRPTPLLLPPADFTQDDLERLQLTGTCEYQVLRSSGDWSLGLKKHEQSIQNAYLQLIEESEHLVYIENQFFVTSTEVNGVVIENQIGNALVQRIVRAHENGEAWRAFILIPLMPGFEAEVDSDKAGSVRVICQCQYNSISRGPNSIFYRLESMGIRPEQYISFFSLRKWGKFSDTPESPNGGRICTELLYIHAKCMIVDDRVAIIGSANINERSMRGLRDSEVAVCVRDTKVVNSKMAGKPWRAGKFAHSLRMRLMREHLGVDMDKLDIIDRCLDSLLEAAKMKARHMHRAQHDASQAAPSPSVYTRKPDQRPLSVQTQRIPASMPASPLSSPVSTPAPTPLPGTPLETPAASIKNVNFDGQTNGPANGQTKGHAKGHANGHTPGHDDDFPSWLYPELHSYNWYGGTKLNRGLREHKSFSTDSRITNNAEHKADVAGEGVDHWASRLKKAYESRGGAGLSEKEEADMEQQAKEIMERLMRDPSISSVDQFKRVFYQQFTKTDILRPLKRAADLPIPRTDDDGLRAVGNENIPIDPWCFDDPLDTRFYQDRWLAAAERNTRIFRLVFRCQPDNEVQTWKDYKQFQGHLERFYEKQKEDGGPNALRKQGHHEPERVDKYVLGGTIQRKDPELMKEKIMKAKDADYYHRKKKEEEEKPQDTPRRKLIQHTRRPSEPSHPELHRYARNIKGQVRAKLGSGDQKLQEHLDQFSLRHHDADTTKHDKSRPVLGEATEFGAHFERRPPMSRNASLVGSMESGIMDSVNHYRHSHHRDGSLGGPHIPSEGHNAGPHDSQLDRRGSQVDPHDSRAERRDSQADPLSHIYERGHDYQGDAMLSPKSETSMPTFPPLDNEDMPSVAPTAVPSIAPSTTTQEPLTPLVADEDESSPLNPTESSRLRSRSGSFTRTRRWDHFEHVLDAQVAEDMLQGVTGQLVIFPTEWLNRELDSGNWNFQFDHIAPLEIYD